jgi:hypothetical protein
MNPTASIAIAYPAAMAGGEDRFYSLPRSPPLLRSCVRMLSLFRGRFTSPACIAACSCWMVIAVAPWTTVAAPQQPAPAAQATAPQRAVSPPAAPQQRPPSLLGAPPVQFEPATLDLGTLKPGAKASGTIIVHNISDKTLTIKATRASCTCTTINLANTVLAPGQAVPLDVAYHASSTMGPKTASVRILFDGYDLVEVPIQAVVALMVRATPQHIDSLVDEHGSQALTGEFTVYAYDQRPFRVLAVNGQPPDFANFDPATESPRNNYLLKWDLTPYDPVTCKNEKGERLPGWIIVETDHPDAPVIDLEIRHDCNRRKPAQPTDTWAASDKRVLLGALRPGEAVEAEVLVKWLPQRAHEDGPRVAVSESPLFNVELTGSEPNDDGMLVKVRITPVMKAPAGLVQGAFRLHSNRQSAPVTVIGSVRP